MNEGFNGFNFVKEILKKQKSKLTLVDRWNLWRYFILDKRSIHGITDNQVTVDVLDPAINSGHFSLSMIVLDVEELVGGLDFIWNWWKEIEKKESEKKGLL